MSVHIGELKGITDAVVNVLKAKGLGDSDALLTAAKTPSGRSALAAAAGIDATRVLELANRADLARIKGIGRVYSDLMEEAGVDTVVELSKRVPENLHSRLLEINSKKRLTHRPPSLDQVVDFVQQAKSLPRALDY